jgi:hypothetical protein
MNKKEAWNRLFELMQSVIIFITLIWTLVSALGLFVLPIVVIIKYIMQSPVVVWKIIALEVVFLFVLATSNLLKNLATARTYHFPTSTLMQIVRDDIMTLLKPIIILTIEIGAGVLLIV